MKLQHVLLYTRDPGFDDVLAKALFGAGAIVRVARNVADALAIVCEGRVELDFAVMDFYEGCRGMTLLSAMHTCKEDLPIIVITSTDTEPAMAVAYANGARISLAKPVSSTQLAAAIENLRVTATQFAAA